MRPAASSTISRARRARRGCCFRAVPTRFGRTASRSGTTCAPTAAPPSKGPTSSSSTARTRGRAASRRSASCATRESAGSAAYGDDARRARARRRAADGAAAGAAGDRAAEGTGRADLDLAEGRRRRARRAAAAGRARTGARGRARSSPGASSAAGSIEVAGFVPEEEIDAIWARATVFAMPSLTEGFGLVFIEAMRRGLPVDRLARRRGRGGQCRRRRPATRSIATSRSGWSRRSSRCCGIATSRVELGAAGQARWRAEFSFSAFAARLDAALGDFLR